MIFQELRATVQSLRDEERVHSLEVTAYRATLEKAQAQIHAETLQLEVTIARACYLLLIVHII